MNNYELRQEILKFANYIAKKRPDVKRIKIEAIKNGHKLEYQFKK